MLNQKELAIKKLAENYSNFNAEQLNQLLMLTASNKVSFVNIKGYNSDVSDNTEVADQLININGLYENMLNKDENIFANFDVAQVDVDAFNYETINMGELTLFEFKQQVKENLPLALSELNAPKKRKDTSADIWLNRSLVFNLNTLRLSILGQQVNKQIVVSGEFKKVKSSPKTVAKRLIERKAKGRAQSLRRFALDNILSSVKLKGETLEIA